jgi:hypothetical protein
VAQARAKYGISERWACRLLQQGRGTQRYAPLRRIDEAALTSALIALAGQYGRYGYRRVTALLNPVRLAGRQRPGAADLAAGRVEGTAETASARAFVA